MDRSSDAGIGDIVHYVHPQFSEHFAAIVTRTQVLGGADITVFKNDGLIFVKLVHHNEVDKSLGSWHWPE